MSSETAVTTTTQRVPAIYDKDQANHLYTLAQRFSNSSLVPAHFRNKPDDCFIALEMAQRMNSAPLMVLQNLYIVHGRPGWTAQFLIAMANQSGTFTSPIMFEESGEGRALVVKAYATHAVSGERVEAESSMAMAEAEGWTKNTKYQTMPVVMLRYRAATFLIRTYAPEVTMGIPTYDEVKEVDVTDQVQVDQKNGFEAALLMAESEGINVEGCVTWKDLQARKKEHKKAQSIETEAREVPEPKPEPRSNADIASAAAAKVKAESDSSPEVIEIADVLDRIDKLEKAIVATGPKNRAKAAAGIDDDVYSASEDEARTYLSLLEAEAKKQSLKV